MQSRDRESDVRRACRLSAAPKHRGGNPRGELEGEGEGENPRRTTEERWERTVKFSVEFTEEG